MRDKATTKRLQMYNKGGKVVRLEVGKSFSRIIIIKTLSRNRDGRVVKPAPFQARAKSGEVARIEPNRKWFG